MPRKARIDAPNALHHIIIRGIDRRVIFTDDSDREKFLERLSDLLTDSQTPCYAWALMSDHAHLLLRTGRLAIALIMQRLLTGYRQSKIPQDPARSKTLYRKYYRVMHRS
jgi:REP element-mobilizing transposase RayT